MNVAFEEHSLFALPIDGCVSNDCKIKGESASEEDDTTVSDPSFHNSIDYGKDADEFHLDSAALNIQLSQVSLAKKQTKACLDQYLCAYKKSLLLNTSISVFYDCYRVETDKIDENCLSIMILRSIKASK